MYNCTANEVLFGIAVVKKRVYNRATENSKRLIIDFWGFNFNWIRANADLDRIDKECSKKVEYFCR